LESTDLSIGDISNDPIGERYKLYGQRFDAHRRFPVLFVSGSGVDNPYYVDDSGNSIEWDHGRVPLTFSKTRPGGTLTIDLSTRQNNIEKFSLENSIMNTLPNEFRLCVHGYFDTTDTGWTSNNFMLREKAFTKIFEERGSGSSITIPAANGGPILLIRERRNSSNSLLSTLVVTTADLDRYKNNRQAYGSNIHEVEIYGDIARNLESNIIIWACGHELLVEG
jgi:hypothetical protein